VSTDCVEVYTQQKANGNASFTVLIIKKSDGFIYAAGTNSSGLFGIGSTTLFNPLFTQLTWVGQNPKFVYVSGETSLGMLFVEKADGSKWFSGDNTNFRMFTSLTSSTNTGVDITSSLGGLSERVTYVHSESKWHSSTTNNIVEAMSLIATINPVGVTKVYTCGDNTYGQIGDGTTLATAGVGYSVPAMSDITDIDVIGGAVPTIRVLKTNGDLYQWGYGVVGKLPQLHHLYYVQLG